jgi:hypothetical protein
LFSIDRDCQRARTARLGMLGLHIYARPIAPPIAAIMRALPPPGQSASGKATLTKEVVVLCPAVSSRATPASTVASGSDLHCNCYDGDVDVHYI